ncbi:hypothetical protein MMC15_002294 [Xylographa vitiligo]|nr:hypothetical protein [Xylographa vitiligo]
MPGGISVIADSSSMASPVDSPRSRTSRSSTIHSRKRSWPHEDEERIRASKRNRQQGLVPQNGAAASQHFPTMMFQTPQYFPPVSQQALPWLPQPDSQFNVALNPASAHIMAPIHGTGLSSQSLGPYQPQHTQPTYAGPVSDQQEWIATIMQGGSHSVPPPNVNTDSFGQLVDIDAIARSDFIYLQHDANHTIGHDSGTQNSVPLTHPTFNQAFNFDQSLGTYQPPQSILPMSIPFTSTIPSGTEMLLETDERCGCGPSCSCEGCGIHFNNVPTRNLVGDLNSILVKDDVFGQHEGQLFSYNQNSTSPNDICREPSTIIGTTPGNLPSPANSLGEDWVSREGVVESDFSVLAGANQPEEHPRLLREYVTVGYSFDTAPAITSEFPDLPAEAENNLRLRELTVDLPAGHPLNSVALFGAPVDEFTGDYFNPIGDYIHPLGNLINQVGDITTPVREVIDLSADENDPVSPMGQSSCCRK